MGASSGRLRLYGSNRRLPLAFSIAAGRYTAASERRYALVKRVLQLAYFSSVLLHLTPSIATFYLPLREEHETGAVISATAVLGGTPAKTSAWLPSLRLALAVATSLGENSRWRTRCAVGNTLQGNADYASLERKHYCCAYAFLFVRAIIFSASGAADLALSTNNQACLACGRRDA